MRTNNGRRAMVKFGPYAGPAGVVEIGSYQRVSFVANARQMRNVTEGMIDDAACSVLGCQESEAVTGMVLLTVQRAGDGN